MPDGNAYYFTPVDGKWVLKKAGGVKALREFLLKEEALAYAQSLSAKQKASFRLQHVDGTWEDL